MKGVFTSYLDLHGHPIGRREIMWESYLRGDRHIFYPDIPGFYCYRIDGTAHTIERSVWRGDYDEPFVSHQVFTLED